MEETGAISSYKKACKYPNLLPLYESRICLSSLTRRPISFSTPHENKLTRVKLTKIENVDVWFFPTDLNRAIVCSSFLPFKISGLHLSGFFVKLTNASLCIFAIRTNVKRLAAVIFNAFKLTFQLVNNCNRVHDMTK